ncbi:hypothetical protein QJS04_geneDACA018969 [Acorus gramineus]|uniref:Uncharacterized protein n=1 Tax=Acorus gramineus TaxID=55184 RepID=A0AAV9AEJ3_ACOGR|nr:hypothetical protein QJS04_geneDACA018969 [Acorus gramineus]
MSSLSYTIVVSSKHPKFPSFSGGSWKPSEKCSVNLWPANVSLLSNRQRKAGSQKLKSQFTIRAGYSADGGRSSSAGIFVGGFMLGGIIVGTLGCVYAPQISKALAGTDRKDLMRKLPKFIYDEEKALEKTRKILTEKIAQLNSAIDDVSSQLHADESPNGVAVASGEVGSTA